MDKDKDKNKGLADNQEGEFILNESGTSVTIDVPGDYSEDHYDPATDPDEIETPDQGSQEKS